MAYEWQSLLQGAPDLEKINLLGNFNAGYSTAVEQKKTAYDMYRTQKAQEIAAKASRPDGSTDWDTMFKLGNEAGLGLDVFNQVHKMQQDRAAAESALKQQQGLLRSMGEDRTLWDPSAKPIDVFMREEAAKRNFETVDTTPSPYVAPTAEESARYAGLVVPAPSETATLRTTQAPGSEVQSPTTSPASTASTATTASTASTATTAPPATTAPAPPSVAEGTTMDLGQKNIVVGLLPAPAMRDPNADDLLNAEGYYNRLWRDSSNYGNFTATGNGGNGGAGGAGDATGSFSVESMGDIAKDRLATYLAGRGVDTKDLQSAVNSLEARAIDSVPKPVMVMPEGTTVEAIAKARNLNMKAQAEYAAKVADAKLKFSDDMQKGNYSVLEKQLAQTASALAKQANERQRAEFERDRAAATKLKEMGVTDRLLPAADVKALQDVFIPAIADISNADKGFGGAMSAAIAKAKVDGSVNVEAVISNLVAMGAMPSDQAAKIMTKMTPEAYTNFAGMLKAGSVDLVMSGLRAFGMDVGIGTGATNSTWKDQALDNVFQQAQAHGMTEAYYKKQKSKSWQSESPGEVLPSVPPPAQTPKPRQEVKTKRDRDGRVRPTGGW